MTPEDFVRERSAGLGTSASTRFYMLKLPQKPTLPAGRVQRIGGRIDQHLRGPQGLQVTRVQVDLFVAQADGYTVLKALAEDVKGDGLGPSASGLWGFKGDVGSPPELRIENVELIHDGTPDYEDEELNLLRIRQDYLVHWKAA